MVSPISKRIKMTKKVGNVRKRMLTRERILLIVEYLNRPEKQKEWTNEIRAAWHDWLGHLDENVTRLYYQLRYMVWKPRAFIVFDKKENNKHRVIYASRPEELIVDILYFDCLQYVFWKRSVSYQLTATAASRAKASMTCDVRLSAKLGIGRTYS